MTDRSSWRPETRRGAPRRRKRKRGWLAFAGYAALGIGCLLIGTVTFLLVAAPVDLVRDRLVQQVQARTGRDLVVSGPASLVIFPKPAVSFSNVALSAPPAMGGEPTLTVQGLEAEVGLASLLGQRPAITRLVLTRPTIELRVDAEGRRSWDLGGGKASAVADATVPGGASGAPTERGRATGDPLRSGHGANDKELATALASMPATSLKMVGGSLRYVDERSGARHDISAMDLEVDLTAGGGPLRAKGTFEWRGEKLAVDTTLSGLRALIEERSGRLSLKLAGALLEADYDGTVATGSALGISGSLRANAPSSRALAAWAGNKPIAGRELGALQLTAMVDGSADRLELRDLSGALGNASASGTLTVERRPERPSVAGSLRLSQLDLGALLIRPAAEGTPRPRPQPDFASPAAAQARGVSKRGDGKGDWSDDVIDLAPLGLADADLAITTDSLLYKEIKTGQVRVALNLKDQVAKLTLEDMALYEGRGRGVVTLDGRGPTAAATASLLLEGIAALPLLNDALGFHWLEGRSNIAVRLSGQGASERQIVSTLNGTVDVATANGRIDAIDVSKILQGLEQGRLTGLRMGAGDKTAFSELAATFTIVSGIADNQNLRLVSPNLRVTGAGTINLPARSLDYTVRPKVESLNASTERAVINLANVEIPVRIQGPWDKPSFTVPGQEKLIEAVKEIGKNIKSKDVEEALKGLLGGSDGEKRAKPRDILEKLLKKP
ncbi:MAG TPA: AsmA family protein [Hyphomicrobiaceae bacterium]|nr:AsmA family protein [Hyphomicrobiaceae bacterium]